VLELREKEVNLLIWTGWLVHVEKSRALCGSLCQYGLSIFATRDSSDSVSAYAQSKT